MKGGALGTLTYNPYHTEVKSLHQPKQSTTEDEPQKGSILRQRPSVRFSWLTCEDHHKTDEYFANINHDFSRWSRVRFRVRFFFLFFFFFFFFFFLRTEARNAEKNLLTGFCQPKMPFFSAVFFVQRNYELTKTLRAKKFSRNNGKLHSRRPCRP